MIWQDAESYDRKSATEKIIPARRLMLDVSAHGFNKMNVYHPTALGMSDPNNGALPVDSVSSPRIVPIDVPDHVMIIELTK
jgi:hypothetical protein